MENLLNGFFIDIYQHKNYLIINQSFQQFALVNLLLRTHGLLIKHFSTVYKQLFIVAMLKTLFPQVIELFYLDSDLFVNASVLVHTHT